MENLGSDVPGRIFITEEDALRDNFAINAPRCPEEFKPVMSGKEPEPITVCPERYPAYIKNIREIEAWKREEDLQRIIQWPYYYADMVLIQRDKKKNLMESGKKIMDRLVGIDKGDLS